MMETDQVVQEIEESEGEDDEIKDEPRVEGAEAEGEDEEEVEEEDENEAGNPPGENRQDAAPIKKKRERKEPVLLERELGKSLLPFSRVQKIIKADKEIPVIAKDAVFLISLATEAFIEELAQAAQRVAEKERRTMVQHKDIATVVRKADEFMFLEDLIPWTSSEPEKKRGKPVPGAQPIERTMLDQFVVPNKERQDRDGEMEVVMNEDGTMYATDD